MTANSQILSPALLVGLGALLFLLVAIATLRVTREARHKTRASDRLEAGAPPAPPYGIFPPSLFTLTQGSAVNRPAVSRNPTSGSVLPAYSAVSGFSICNESDSPIPLPLPARPAPVHGATSGTLPPPYRPSTGAGSSSSSVCAVEPAQGAVAASPPQQQRPTLRSRWTSSAHVPSCTAAAAMHESARVSGS